MIESGQKADIDIRHGEYKIPGGKLVVVDLEVERGRLCNVQLSGDFFLEPTETLDAINMALNHMSARAPAGAYEKAAQGACGPDVSMYGISAEGIEVVIRRALA